MALEGSLQDFDRGSFVECPSGSKQPARRALICNDSSNPVPVSVNPAGTPTIFNISVPLAATEVSQALPANTKSLTIRCRGAADIQFSFSPSGSSTNFITIRRGSVYSQDGLLIASGTLYLQTSLAAQTVEVLTWS